MFRVGDLVTEADRPLWYYGLGSLYDGYWDTAVPHKKSIEPPPRRPTETLIGFIIETVEREAMGYQVTPFCVYRVKWLNPPDGDWYTWRIYYEDELKLISAIEILGASDEE